MSKYIPLIAFITVIFLNYINASNTDVALAFIAVYIMGIFFRLGENNSKNT